MKIHFIGIGGIGMSALAGIAKESGFEVTGSDLEKNEIIEKLRNIGIKVFIGHNQNNISPKTDLVIITPAIKKNNPELIRVKALKIPIKERTEFLSDLAINKKIIAISGTHGKTTISSMIAVILKSAKLNPTIAIGGLIPEIKNKNWHTGKGEYMVVEACEYYSAFLKIKPFIAVISNIEEEHLDYFKNIEEINRTFTKFLKLLPQDGFAVINTDNKNTQEIIQKNNFDFPVITYGTSRELAEWRISKLEEKNRQVGFEVIKNKQTIGNFSISAPGKHNAINALAAIIVTSMLNVNFKTIKEALKKFKGAKRRMEELGEKNKILVIDDYGHHPTEITATLNAIKNFYKEKKEIWCVFQPHQYSRTKHLFKEFVTAFKEADHLILTNIYQARDSKKDIISINSKKLAEEIKNKEKINAIYIPDFESTATYLKKNVPPESIILTIGAGPVNKVGELFLK